MADDPSTRHYGGIRRGMVAAAALLAWDIGLSGSFLMSLLVCPIWFLVTLVGSAIRRPGWRLALLRLAIPALTLAIVKVNNAQQLKRAEDKALQVVAACEKYHTVNGKYPETLGDLVPEHMPSVPQAKRCLLWGHFVYFNQGKPMLVWYVVPPHYRKIYDFHDRRWSFLD